MEIQGIAGISVTTDRSKGFADTLEALCGDGIKIVAQQPADFTPDLGLQVMEAILQANSDIDAVYTHDDDMAEGVVAAIENAGREDEMILTGAGGSCTAFDRIESGGLYAATYLYSPTMAGSAVNMARLIAQGQGFTDLVEPEVPSLVVVPPTEVTKDNVAERARALLRVDHDRRTAGAPAPAVRLSVCGSVVGAVALLAELGGVGRGGGQRCGLELELRRARRPLHLRRARFGPPLGTAEPRC